MKLRTLLLACGASLALAGIASAQSPMSAPLSAPTPPPARHGYPALPPHRIAVMVRASGLAPLFRPMRQGDTYVLRALDRNAVEYRLVIDAYTGRNISVRATSGRGAPGYGADRGPVYGRLFGPRDDRYDDRYGYGELRPPLPPRARLPQPNAQPTTQAGTPMPHASPAPAGTAQTPLPRPRPYVMEATSSIPADAPKTVEPQKTPPPPPAPQAPVTEKPAPPAAPAATPQNNGGVAMPPVTPLD